MSPSISLQVLASGSSGNATFLRFGEQRLLVDAGISYRRIAQRLEQIGEQPDRLDAVWVTHEHIDHVLALPMLRKRHPELPIFATAGTIRSLIDRRRWSLNLQLVEPGECVRVSEVEITPFSTCHDACESVGYRFDWQGSAVGIATDLGHASEEVIDALRGCRVLVIEANHDPTMLQSGPYPAHLKRRIASRQGHMSNAQAADLVSRVAGPALEHVILAHLSQENNNATFARDEVQKVAGEVLSAAITVARQDIPTPLIVLEAARR